VLPKSLQMPGQRRPKGLMWTTSPAWKRQVTEAMEAAGVTRAELSRRVGVSDAAITQLFSTKTKQSRLVPDINRVLGLTPPVQTSGESDEELAELIDIWRELSSEERKVLWGTARVLRRSKG
jgi:transcriptional regulator with XRE-family HTH domain